MIVFSKTMGASVDWLVADTLGRAPYTFWISQAWIVALMGEVHNADNVPVFKIPVLKTAKPVTKSRREIANFFLPYKTGLTIRRFLPSRRVLS